MPVDPVITHLVFRNLPRRCVPESEEDVDLPVLLTMELGELEVIDGGEADTADWNLTALCEVDDARSIVIDRVEGISLPSVSTGETIAINPDSRRVLDDLGVLPGVEIRCGVSGLVNDGTPEGRVIRYIEDRFVVPEATTEAVSLDRVLDGTGGTIPRFRLNYRVSVSPVE